MTRTDPLTSSRNRHRRNARPVSTVRCARRLPRRHLRPVLGSQAGRALLWLFIWIKLTSRPREKARTSSCRGCSARSCTMCGSSLECVHEIVRGLKADGRTFPRRLDRRVRSAATWCRWSTVLMCRYADGLADAACHVPARHEQPVQDLPELGPGVSGLEWP